MVTLFAFLAFLVGLAGLLFMSQATSGVGMIAFACLLGILARITQAERQHKELMTPPLRSVVPDGMTTRP